VMTGTSRQADATICDADVFQADILRPALGRRRHHGVSRYTSVQLLDAIGSGPGGVLLFRPCGISVTSSRRPYSREPR
jgi:hypothetical protein